MLLCLAAPLLGSSRFALCLMTGVAMLFLYLLRINLGLTMVCMVRKRTRKQLSHNDSMVMLNASSYVTANTDEWYSTKRVWSNEDWSNASKSVTYFGVTNISVNARSLFLVNAV
jgi:hypothetical protein